MMGIPGFVLGVALVIGAGLAISAVVVPLVNWFHDLFDWVFRLGR